jgi:hypothetical protein
LGVNQQVFVMKELVAARLGINHNGPDAGQHNLAGTYPKQEIIC